MPATHPTVPLPDGDNIPTLLLTRLIAEALLPDLENCEGMGCVMGMRKSTESGVFPFKLNKADREALEPLFADLPKVRGCMSEHERQDFLSAYEKHPQKPNGAPYFATQFDIDRRKNEIQLLDDAHQDVLRKKIKSGEVNVFDHIHCPTDSLGINVFMSRLSAEKYLGSINLTSTPADQPKERSIATGTHADEITVTASQPTENPKESQTATSSEKHRENEHPEAIAMTSVKHTVDVDAPHIPPKTNSIGRIAMKAAWLIQEEHKRPAKAREVFNKLIEWYRSKSSYAEATITDFDEKEVILKWIAPKFPQGKPYNLKACQRHIKLWQASSLEATGDK